jgi:hypothetical protein
MYRIVGRRGSAFIPPLSRGVFSLRPFNPAEINIRSTSFMCRLGRLCGNMFSTAPRSKWWWSMQVSDLKIHAYLLHEDYRDRVVLERALGPDGVRWAIRNGGSCLNRRGRWEIEPFPSSRTDAFYARCRYATPDDALQVWTQYLLNNEVSM